MNSPSLLTADTGVVVSGPATVIDGDTLIVQGQSFDLYGIAAPQLGQPCVWPTKTINCGLISKTALMDLTLASNVECALVENPVLAEPPHTLNPARCHVGGYDLAKNMVHTGWAMVDERIGDQYLSTQQKAQAAPRGLWKGTFELPWDWHGND